MTAKEEENLKKKIKEYLDKLPETQRQTAINGLISFLEGLK